MNFEFNTGSLVKYRERIWIIQPSDDPDLKLLKPLGGTEDEITGVYLPLLQGNEKIESAHFGEPDPEKTGDFISAKLLYNACRLSFRNGAGPFRTLGKLSFRPRSYQMVPLIMSLRQENPVRLIIADDVGVGKTIEALLILKEYIERGIVKKFSIIVLPHLCEQWKSELSEKFGIEAVIIRSNTQARLDREIIGDTSVFDYYKYQIISIDYIKSEARRDVFIKECPDFVIVDEAHTCTIPDKHNTVQQQRHHLIKELSKKESRSILLLTATPHSGKTEQFNSLLALANEGFREINIPESTQTERAELAKYFVQRRRADVEKWMDEDTKFPVRDAGEFPYELSTQYREFFDEMLKFTLGIFEKDSGKKGSRLKYWAALALLRGVMSSPQAGVTMLENRMNKLELSASDIFDGEESVNPLYEKDYGFDGDNTPVSVINKAELTADQIEKLSFFRDILEDIKKSGTKQDIKARAALEVVKKWSKDGFNTIIFCRYIETANYLADIIKREYEGDKNTTVQAITSEDPDEVRKERIDAMQNYKRRILVCTDCLSEGINLQDYFTALLHYDLPWNPNRLEQREGRIDRFGQEKDTVRTYMLYGKENPIDGVVLRVLLKKVREIKKITGISMPFPEDSQSLLDSVFESVMRKAKDLKATSAEGVQSTLFEDQDLLEKELIATKAIEKAAEREKASRSIFAQNAIKANEIQSDLNISNEAIGTPEDVETFVFESLSDILGVQMEKDKKGYVIYTDNLPAVLKPQLPDLPAVKVSFYSPTPENYLYIGRNHIFVEQLSQYIMSEAGSKDLKRVSRTSAIKSKAVSIKTAVYLFRVRNVIENKSDKVQTVAEEMILWGYKGGVEDKKHLSHDEAKELLSTAQATSALTPQAKENFIRRELENYRELKKSKIFDVIAEDRAKELVKAHERFRKLLKGSTYGIVEPVLPMDLMGIYMILPE